MCELYFVYGTLTENQQVERLLSSYEFRGRATCVGLERIDGEYPTLVPGDSVEGRLLTTPAGDRVDRYEGVDEGLYHRVRIPLSSQLTQQLATQEQSPDSTDTAKPDHTHATTYTEAVVYIAEPAKLGIPDETGWPTGEFPDCITSYRDATDLKIVTEKE